MDYIQEVEEYTENIFLIKLDTLVKGYDGTDLGCSNQQAQELANRTKWLKRNLELLEADVKQKLADIIEKENNDIVSLTKKIDDAIKDVKENIDALSSRVDVEAEKGDKLAGDLTSLAGDVTTLRKGLTDVNQALGETNTQLDNVSGYLADVAKDVDDTKKTVGSLNKDVTGLVKDINDTKTAVDTLNKDVAGLTTQLDNTNKKVDAVDTTLKGAVSDISALDKRVTSLDESVSDINGKLDSVNKDISDLNDDFTTKLTETKEEINNSVDEKIDITKNALEKSVSDLTKSVNESVAKLESEQQSLSSDVQDVFKSVADLTDEAVLKDEIKTVFGETLVGTGDVTLTSKILGPLIKGGSGITVAVKDDTLEITNADPDNTAWELKTFDNAKKGDIYFFKAPEDYLNTYMLHNFFKYFNKTNYKSNVVRKYSGSVLSGLIKNETLNVDTDGNILSESVVDYTLTKNNTMQFKAIRLDLKTGMKVTGIRIVSDRNVTTTAIHEINSDSEEVKYRVTPFAVNNYSNFEPRKLFGTPYSKTDAANVPAFTYWSGASYFYAYKTDVYVGISLDNPKLIHGYKIQCIDKFRLTASTLAKSWRFEASTSRDAKYAKWVVLDTQTNVDLSLSQADSDGFKYFKLPETLDRYASVRIVITDVQNTSARPSLTRLNLIVGAPLMLEDTTARQNFYSFNEKGEIYKTGNAYLTIIEDLLHEKGFYDTGICKINDLSEITKYDVFSNLMANVHVYLYGEKVQLRIDPDIEKDKYAILSINKFKINLAKGQTFNGKIALINNDNNWYAYKEGQWVQILSAPGKTYSYDQMAPMLYDLGMTLTTFNSIPESDIIKFMSDLSGDVPKISIAYAVYNQRASDPVVPDSLTINYSNEIGWEPVYKESIKVKFSNKRMIVEVLDDGSYKLLYSFFNRDA